MDSSSVRSEPLSCMSSAAAEMRATSARRNCALFSAPYSPSVSPSSSESSQALSQAKSPAASS